MNLFNIFKAHLLSLADEVRREILHWRTLLRPLAFVFVILHYFYRPFSLYLVGILGLFFVMIDLARLLNRKINFFLFSSFSGFLKSREGKSFSSMTFFLTAIFLLFLVFGWRIASLAVLFLTFGDLAAKCFGLVYGRHSFLHKTMEGTLAYFGFALVIGAVFVQFIPLPFYVVLPGAICAAFAEALSVFGLDDNFVVDLVSGGLMEALIRLI